MFYFRFLTFDLQGHKCTIDYVVSTDSDAVRTRDRQNKGGKKEEG